MRCSDLEDKLQRLRDEHGDCEVTVLIDTVPTTSHQLELAIHSVEFNTDSTPVILIVTEDA